MEIQKRMRSFCARLAQLGLLINLTSLAAHGAEATVSTFTGGDPGEGLDLQGNFAYAVNAGPDGGVGKIGDADFTADNVTGVTLTAPNNIGAGGWLNAVYGETDNDKRLAVVMNSIRWADAPRVVTVKLKVEKGIEYKLQILEGENCCPGRGFNIEIDGQIEVANFMPGPTQATESGDFESSKNVIGAVITKQFVAASNEVTIVFDGPAADSADISDRNAIVNGFTLERISPVTDVDNDGLRDDWENKYFGNLDQTADGDADGDGLKNSEEQTLTTDPSKADTDGDGLTDGDEIKTYKSDPLKTDSDGDSLADGFEVNVLKTDPTKQDSDGDGTSDPREVSLGTDPADANSKPLTTTIGIYTGSDPSKGLDLNGEFTYALSLGGDVPNQVRDALFQPLTLDEVPGATLVSGHVINHWYNGGSPDTRFGEAPEDIALAEATSSIAWSEYVVADNPQVVLTLTELEPGAEYKVQMMFGEECCNRGFDILVDDQLVVKDLNPGLVHGGIAKHTQQAVVTHLYFAKSNTMVIRFDGRGTTTNYVDHNATASAVTVEKIAGKTDTDADGLPDEWEKLYFGNLNQTATADPDGDGLNNADEYALGSDPTKPDTDRDGLSDSVEKAGKTDPRNRDTDFDGLTDKEETDTTKTDPLKADTDGDGLNDRAEVVVYKTNPKSSDTDGDGFADGTELVFGTDPAVADPGTQFSNTGTAVFTGGDPDEGLDLQGTFAYALNIGTTGAAGKAGDADFTADIVTGVKVTTINEIPNWLAPAYGDTPNDDVLEAVMASMRWSPSPDRPKIELDVVPETTYKLQLLFGESCCAGRGFNIVVDDTVLAPDFIVANEQGGLDLKDTQGAVLTTELTTHRSKLTIVIDGPGATSPDITDRNSTISGLTLEVIKAAPASLRITGTTKGAGGISITFDSVSGKTYTLEYKAQLADPTWTPAGTLNATGGTATITDGAAGHLSGGTGFWRLKTQ